MSCSCVLLKAGHFNVSQTCAEKIIWYSAEVNCCIWFEFLILGSIMLSSFKVYCAGYMLASFPWFQKQWSQGKTVSVARILSWEMWVHDWTLPPLTNDLGRALDLCGSQFSHLKNKWVGLDNLQETNSMCLWFHSHWVKWELRQLWG